MKLRLFLAGSGGQGTLTIGQMISKAAMDEGKETTWLPSYGPEMRGGTANCTVIVSDKPVACPVIDKTDVLLAMNLPSLLKFEHMIEPGGLLIINSDLVPEKPKRDDIRVLKIPANEAASQAGNDRAANMVILGAIIGQTHVVDPETVREEIRHMFAGRKEKYIPSNLAAFDMYL